MRWLYLSGLGTGWRSRKGAALARRLAAYGVQLECVDLRVPAFHNMRLAAMVGEVERTLESSAECVLIGTSFGGYVAAQIAATDPRVSALVLYAPALHLAELRHWHPRVT